MLDVGHSPVFVHVAPVEARELVGGQLLEWGGIGAVHEVRELEAGGARGRQWLAGEAGEVER